jgi:hypothetical protein
MLLNPVKLKNPEPTAEGRAHGQDGSTWYVWSDNVDERTLSCLPYPLRGDDGLFVYDLKTFGYDDVLYLPRVLNLVQRAAATGQGMLDNSIYPFDADDLAEACAAGLIQQLENGRATLTEAGRQAARHS